MKEIDNEAIKKKLEKTKSFRKDIIKELYGICRQYSDCIACPYNDEEASLDCCIVNRLTANYHLTKNYSWPSIEQHFKVDRDGTYICTKLKKSLPRIYNTFPELIVDMKYCPECGCRIKKEDTK